MQANWIDGQWRPAAEVRGDWQAVDPRSGEHFGEHFPICGWADVDAALGAAAAACAGLADAESGQVAHFLDDYATRIEGHLPQLAVIAERETGLPQTPRLLSVEGPRTVHQLRLAAAAAREDSWRDVVVDRANGIARCRQPLGKAVWCIGPNNFPLAFNGISGSDFASAIVARNPVIAKAHPGHPNTTLMLAQLAAAALQASGLPPATVQLIHHLQPEDGLRMAADARLGAIGFTGSQRSGLALKAAADRGGALSYLELGSVNPVFVLPGAANHDGDSFSEAFLAGATLGGGQFCTNPGLLVLPQSARAQLLVQQLAERYRALPPAQLLGEAVAQGLHHAVARLCAAGAELCAGSADPFGPGFRFPWTLLSVAAERYLQQAEVLQQEAFGPLTLVVHSATADQRKAIVHGLEGQLTGTLWLASDGSDYPEAATLGQRLRPKVGRLLENKLPPGVAVSPAMHHGGPFPSSVHPGFTAVGMPAAILRFTQLACYDNVARARLPAVIAERWDHAEA